MSDAAPKAMREVFGVGVDQWGRPFTLTRERRAAAQGGITWRLEREPVSQLDERTVFHDIPDSVMRNISELIERVDL